MLFFSAKTDLKRVLGGRKAVFKCLACKTEGTFHECITDEKISAYFVIDLWKKNKRLMQCGECLAVCDYYDAFPEEKAREEQAREQQQKKQQEEEAAARRRSEEEAARKREEADKKRSQEVDDELARIKRELNK